MCVCFCAHFLSTHNSPLSTCVFVLYPLPSLHPTQPTKTTVCQPRFIIFCSLFQSKILFFFLPFSLSLAPSLWATPRPFAWVLIWYERRENLSLWIYVSDDTSDISLEWSRVTSFLQKKITIFKINPWLPPIFPFFFLLCSLSDVPRAKTGASLNHNFSCSVVFW